MAAPVSGIFLRLVDVVVFVGHALVLALCWAISPLVALWYGWKDRAR